MANKRKGKRSNKRSNAAKPSATTDKNAQTQQPKAPANETNMGTSPIVEAIEPPSLPKLEDIEDPSADNYHNDDIHTPPIARLPDAVMESFTEGLRKYYSGWTPEMIAVEAEKREQILRGRRWFRFHGLDDDNSKIFRRIAPGNLKFFSRGFEHNWITRRERMTSDEFDNFVESIGIVEKSDVLSFYCDTPALERVKKSPVSLANVRSFFEQLGIDKISDKKEQCAVKVGVMEEWWECWVEAQPMKIEKPNPFSAIVRGETHTDLAQLSGDQCNHRLANLAFVPQPETKKRSIAESAPAPHAKRAKRGAEKMNTSNGNPDKADGAGKAQSVNSPNGTYSAGREYARQHYQEFYIDSNFLKALAEVREQFRKNGVVLH